MTRGALALGMGEAVLGKWVRAARNQAARPAGNEALEQENKRLRAQLARAEMERDILKKRSSDAFTQLLDRTQAIASLSRPGNPYDNALAERGWGTLKTELLPRGACFANLQEARLELAEYLDHYYNPQRLHAALGYCTPLETERHYLFNLP